MGDLVLLPLVLLPLGLHQLQSGLHEGVVVTTKGLQLPAKRRIKTENRARTEVAAVFIIEG